ncbi:glycosyltransferase family 4 protein [Mycoplasmatota bacterium]|nr:glycosyltransferase family 4 protein [Mycoplasmatota bacterium]
MKILIISNSIHGLYNQRFELIEKFIEEGHDVTICAPNELDNYKVQEFINLNVTYIKSFVNRRGSNPITDSRTFFSYMKVLKVSKPNVVLTYTVKPNIYGAIAARLFKVPVIMNITGIGTALVSSKLKTFVINLYKISCNKVHTVFFQNTSNKEMFIENEIVEEEKTQLIPGSGVNVNKYYPLSKTRDDEVIRFLYIGRLMKEKGIEEYLEAAERITEEHSNVEFQILGNYEEIKYKNIIAQSPRIRFLGSSNDVRNEIKAVDCIVNPSYHEGMSNVLLESAAMGKPLLASNIPGCKEIVSNNNGFLFEKQNVDSLCNALTRFITLDKEEVLQMGKKSRELVTSQFDRQIVINSYLNIINSI